MSRKRKLTPAEKRRRTLARKKAIATMRLRGNGPFRPCAVKVNLERLSPESARSLALHGMAQKIGEAWQKPEKRVKLTQSISETLDDVRRHAQKIVDLLA